MLMVSILYVSDWFEQFRFLNFRGGAQVTREYSFEPEQCLTHSKLTAIDVRTTVARSVVKEQVTVSPLTVQTSLPGSISVSR